MQEEPTPLFSGCQFGWRVEEGMGKTDMSRPVTFLLGS